ncbi:peptidyl-prolyl cis-trans isomerase [Deltaproteobacteria bacterium OttesenSCG-928-K17]|nr:peptidyl-prolyl cis-trans isomerase [Deltaproteobacteria bacterium OttesenSCG-928-K17]
MAVPALAQNNPTYVELTTGKGKIVLELNAKAAPKTVANFVGYVQKGHYNGTIFHRVIENFMIQGGGMDSKMQERQTGAPIANEANNGLKNDRYTVAMARTSDPHSATAQFFINTNNNEFLNFKSESAQGWGYAVFGKVVAGQSVVDEIAKVKTGRMGMHENVPVMPIVIEKAVVLTDYKK